MCGRALFVQAHTYSPDTVISAGNIQEWVGEDCTWRALASTHSHMLVLSEQGALYAWEWGTARRGRHARAAKLCAEGDQIVEISASTLRTSVLTASGKVASWLDDVCHIVARQSPTLELDSCTEGEMAKAEWDEHEHEVSEDEVREAKPAWHMDSMACHGDAGKWTIDGNTVELKDGRNYCIAVANIPFPSSGRHSCTVRVVHAPENMAIGVVKSFADVCAHSCHTSKGWIGNGPHGWCLFKDGDAAHDGSWRGGSYSQYSVAENNTVQVIVDADKRTVSFESRGNIREAVYKDLPERVYLAVSLYKEGKIELVSADWEGEGGGTTEWLAGPERLLFGDSAGKP